MAIKRSIALCGLPGTGKTLVGAALAKLLGYTFVNTDDVIASRFKKSIPDIFSEHGESAFRTAEAQLCEELATQEGCVIALGGGTLVPIRNFNVLSKNTVLFALNAKVSTLLERLRNDTSRPLLRKASQADDLQALIEDRRHSFQRIFHQIDTDGKQPDDLAREILLRYQEGEALGTVRFVRMPHLAPYPVLIEDGLLDKLPEVMHWANLGSRRLFVVSHPKLKEKYEVRLSTAFTHAPDWLLINEGEASKSLASVEKLYQALIDRGARRGDVIVAFGGGVVGDVAGFVAATFMRGLAFVQIPTTLLAMVDSSVGGKVGVDLPSGKNLVGAFKQPHFVLCDPSLLKTLPEVEIKCGLGEIIKHALLGDSNLFADLQSGCAIDASFIRRAVAVKAALVEADPYETCDFRALLNLGHTFGHALELESGFALKHGLAVGLGLICAARLGHLLGLCDEQLVEQVRSVLQRWGLPLQTELSPHQVLKAMQHDKKRQEHLRFAVPTAIGHAQMVIVPDSALILDALRAIAH